VLPLAVSGTIVIGVAVVGALLLVLVLFRSEDRDQAEQTEEHDR
jgi:hypothetical protein